MESHTTGVDNVALGYGALYANTTASYNTAVGKSALTANTTGTRNVAVGAHAFCGARFLESSRSRLKCPGVARAATRPTRRGGAPLPAREPDGFFAGDPSGLRALLQAPRVAPGSRKYPKFPQSCHFPKCHQHFHPNIFNVFPTLSSFVLNMFQPLVENLHRRLRL